MVRALITRLNSRIGRIGLTLSVLNYAQAAVGFAINFYLAWRFGAAVYGLISYGIVAGSIVYTVVNFGAERTLVRDLIQKSDPQRILTASLLFRFSLGLLLTILLFLVLPLFISEPEKIHIVLVSALASLFWASAPVAWFDAKYKMHHHASITLVERLIYGLLIVFAMTDRSTGAALSVITFLFITRAASTVFQLFVVGRTVRFDVTGLSRNVKWLASGNVLIVLAALANLMISHWNQLVLEHELSSASLGYYALAFQIIAIVTLLQNQILRIFFPKIASLTSEGADFTKARSAMPRYALFSAGLSLAIVIPIYLLAPRLITLAYPAEFQASLAPLKYLCIWVVFNGGARVINAFLINLRLDRGFFLCAVGASVVAVILGRPLITAHGAPGVAMALLVSHPISVIAQGILVEREFKRRSTAAA